MSSQEPQGSDFDITESMFAATVNTEVLGSKSCCTIIDRPLSTKAYKQRHLLFSHISAVAGNPTDTGNQLVVGICCAQTDCQHKVIVL